MTTDAELVALLVRVDWTGLSLSASVSWRCDFAALQREVARVRAVRRGGTLPPGSEPRAPRFEETASVLVLGPGGHYWQEEAQSGGQRVTVAGDGETSREQEDNPVSGASQTSRPGYLRPLSSLPPPLSELLRPSWLPAGFQLEVIGPVTARGRDAVEFAGRPRPFVMHDEVTGDRVVAIADLELGILLRCEWLSGEVPLMVMELTELRLNPPEPAGPGARTHGEAAAPGLMSRIPWAILRWAAKTSASIILTALAAGLRLAAGVRRLSATQRPVFGAGGTIPAAPQPQPAAPGEPVSVPGHVLDMLYQSWPAAPCVRAELHQWVDPGAMAGSALAGWDATGIRGAGRLAAAIASFDKGTYRADQVLAASRGQYKVETVQARQPRGPSAIACDAQRRWRAYPGRIVVGPAAALRSDVARMIDSAWLLGCRLSGGEPVTAGGRRGYQITARPADGRARSFSGHYVSGQELPAPVVAVVDADSGLLLSLTAFSGEQSALHAELRELTFEPQPRDDDFRIAPSPGMIVTEQTDADADAEADADADEIFIF
jgi:hypothetical protein